MTLVQAGEFSDFFQDVHGFKPFPWQTRLAEIVCGDGVSSGTWPRCIGLPTAAGKTACIDVAVFALAVQARRPQVERTTGRRIFFVVDRRVVVDQAYEHAKTLVRRLTEGTSDVVTRVAKALESIGATPDRPLDAYVLRGGMYRESTWIRSPLQPTIITSTVDQVGSRLLFRGYGVSDASAPLHAALVANDALLFLDEAHCARPFDQTMQRIRQYRTWGSDALAASLPFEFVTMSATPGDDIMDSEKLTLNEADREHPELGRRVQASKPAELIVAEKAKGRKGRWRPGLVTELTEQALRLQSDGFQSVGVIVNRIATARETAEALRKRLSDAAKVILMTGRMRPVDRDIVAGRVAPLLSGKEHESDRPIFVVATQCIEVGADLDFQALVTECASLDALRQRFGRLNRIASREQARGVIVIRKDQEAPDGSESDPVYGDSLSLTWRWLNDLAASGVVDFGIEAMERAISGVSRERMTSLLAPSSDAAVLLPAHLDLLCQTSTKPAPDPDPSLFLHGPSRGEPEVQVVFRGDLGTEPAKWAEIVSLCPPASTEALRLRISELRRWMIDGHTSADATDVEGEIAAEDEQLDAETSNESLRLLQWRGPGAVETKVIRFPGQLRPNGVYVIPIDALRVNELGDFPNGAPEDVGDAAYMMARDRALLRLTPAFWTEDDDDDAPDEIAAIVDSMASEVEQALALGDPIEEIVRNSLTELQTAVIQSESNGIEPWLRTVITELCRHRRPVIARHPLGGVVVSSRSRLHLFDPTVSEPEESFQSSSAQPYPLADHCADVARTASNLAAGAGLSSQVDLLHQAGALHDLGKADPRFQAWLHGGNRRRADMSPVRLAKSAMPYRSASELVESRIMSGYPHGGRHELHSARLAESLACNLSPQESEALLHLIASHHGHCRPFAPVVKDPSAVAFDVEFGGDVIAFTPDPKARSGHGLEGLDGGVPERFWRLTRRFGWWGLAYLEAILRLADWSCSEPLDPAHHLRNEATEEVIA